MIDDHLTLWADPERTRFFLVPDDLTLLPGDYRILNLLGGEKSVSVEALAAYEITRDQASQRVAGKVKSVLGDLKDAFQRAFTGAMTGAATGAAAASTTAAGGEGPGPREDEKTGGGSEAQEGEGEGGAEAGAEAEGTGDVAGSNGAEEPAAAAEEPRTAASQDAGATPPGAPDFSALKDSLSTIASGFSRVLQDIVSTLQTQLPTIVTSTTETPGEPPPPGAAQSPTEPAEASSSEAPAGSPPVEPEPVTASAQVQIDAPDLDAAITNVGQQIKNLLLGQLEHSLRQAGQRLQQVADEMRAGRDPAGKASEGPGEEAIAEEKIAEEPARAEGTDGDDTDGDKSDLN